MTDECQSCGLQDAAAADKLIKERGAGEAGAGGADQLQHVSMDSRG